MSWIISTEPDVCLPSRCLRIKLNSIWCVFDAVCRSKNDSNYNVLTSLVIVGDTSSPNYRYFEKYYGLELVQFLNNISIICMMFAVVTRIVLKNGSKHKLQCSCADIRVTLRRMKERCIWCNNRKIGIVLFSSYPQGCLEVLRSRSVQQYLTRSCFINQIFCRIATSVLKWISKKVQV